MGVTTIHTGVEQEPEYFTIDLKELLLDSEVNFDLYIRPTPDRAPTLYRERNLPFTEETRYRLLENNVSTLYVSSAQEDDYYLYKETNLKTTLANPNLTPKEKTTVLYSTSLQIVREFFSNPLSQQVIPRTERLVSNIVNLLFTEPLAFRSFLEFGRLDYTTYRHSVNVSMYSLTLAQCLGYKDASFLHEFCTGALLHDIGKSKIPRKILDKKGTLSEEEKAILRNHPEWGHAILREHEVTSEIVLDLALNHHEKLSGSGYPRGLKGDQIKSYTRVLTICDIFDALTTRRSYKDALEAFAALDLMKNHMRSEIDQHYFYTFIQMLSTTRPSS